MATPYVADEGGVGEWGVVGGGGVSDETAGGVAIADHEAFAGGG